MKTIRYIPSSDHDLLSAQTPTTIAGTSELQTPRRACAPLQNFVQSGRGLLSPSALDVVRERLELGSMGYGYNRREEREEVRSVVESLDWDWKRVYVYPYSGRGSSVTLGNEVRVESSSGERR